MPKMHTRYYLMDFHSAKGGQIAQGLGAAGSSYLLCQPSPAPARCQTPTDKPARSADAAPRGDPDAGQWPLLDAGHPAGRRGRAPQRHHLLDEVAVVQLESGEFLSVSTVHTPTSVYRCVHAYTEGDLANICIREGVGYQIPETNFLLWYQYTLVDLKVISTERRSPGQFHCSKTTSGGFFRKQSTYFGADPPGLRSTKYVSFQNCTLCLYLLVRR